MRIKFLNFECELMTGYYSNGRKALYLVDVNDHEPVAYCTINLPNEPCPDDQLWIKNYTENEGMAQTLINANVIKIGYMASTQSGYVTIYRYRLSDEILKLFV